MGNGPENERGMMSILLVLGNEMSGVKVKAKKFQRQTAYKMYYF